MLKHRIILIMVILTVYPIGAMASEFYVKPLYKTVEGKVETVYVDILVDTGSSTINAAESEIEVFGANILDTNLKQSIVGFWVKRPTVENSKILFSGVMPGGYSSSGYSGQENVADYNRLFTISLRPTKGVVSLTFNTESTRVLLNDGLGTSDTVKMSEESIDVNNLDVRPKEVDLIPPIDLSVNIVEDSSLPEGTYLFSISATDNQSGVDRYEILDGDTEEWVEVDRQFSTKHPGKVKAVRVFDNSGNVSVLSINKKGNSLLWYILSIVAVLGASYLFYALFCRKYTKTNT